MGAAALVAQSLLARELMVSFYGTEFALAAALTCWLLFIPLGALAAGLALKFCRSARPARAASDLTCLIARFIMGDMTCPAHLRGKRWEKHQE